MGHGDTYPIDLELARRLFPPEAFIEPGGSHGKDGPEPGGSAPDHPSSGCHEPADPEGESCPPVPPTDLIRPPTPSLPMLHPDALHWLSEQAETASTIDDLVEDGWMGCSLEDLIPWLSDREVFERIAAISWQKTAREADGEVALMTADTGGLDGLLEWMLENRGQCPKVYAPDEEPEVPAAIPLLRPLATNLPEGLTSEEVVDADMMEGLADIFAAIKEAFGNQAHLMQFDYGTFAEVLEQHNAVMLKGEFIDLTDGEIFWFTIDGRKRKLAYQSTGRNDPAFRKEVIKQQEQTGTQAAADRDDDQSISEAADATGQRYVDRGRGSRDTVSAEAVSTESVIARAGLASADPQVQEWLESLLETQQSLQALLAEGRIGYSLRELLPLLENDTTALSFLADGWVVTQPDASGDVAILSDFLEMFELLHQSLISEEGQAPHVHAPDDTTLPVDTLPLGRATAFNLPEGTRSHEVVDDKFQELLEEIFKDLQTAYGERAHLYRFDYGTFVEHAENDVIVLTGEFVDLEDGTIYSFTMDGVQQRIRYAETGRIHSSMAVCGGTAVSRETADAAADSTAETTASIP